MSGRRDCHGLDYPRTLKYKNKGFLPVGTAGSAAAPGRKPARMFSSDAFAKTRIDLSGG
jgi:hypothetical protein